MKAATSVENWITPSVWQWLRVSEIKELKMKRPNLGANGTGVFFKNAGLAKDRITYIGHVHDVRMGFDENLFADRTKKIAARRSIHGIFGQHRSKLLFLSFELKTWEKNRLKPQ